MSTTIYDIAQRSGVTTATVSVVLNNKKSRIGVSDATRKRVLQAAEDLNYRPSFSARSLARGRTFTLGLLCRGIENPHFAEVTAVTLREANKLGYHLSIALVDYESQVEPEMELLLQRNVEGIILWSHQPREKYYQYLQSRRIPAILCQSEYKDLPAIRCDWRPGMNEAIDFLKAKGQSRIGYINQDRSFSKKQAFIEACEQRGVAFVVFECTEKTEECRELGRALARDLHRPETVLVFSDYGAMGVLHGLHEQGLNVPSDIGVIGLGGTRLGELFNPPLTTIDQAKDRMAALAVERMVEMVQSKQGYTGTTLLPASLIVRNSA